MPDPGYIRFFTVDEANAALPSVRERVLALRETRRRVRDLQAKTDVEELTLAGTTLDRGPLRALIEETRDAMAEFQRGLALLRALGCELKDLDRGLVDFYARRGDDVVYLCWMEGEDSLAWWHPLDAGFQGRAPL
jgi:hypothetical protein